MNLYRRSEYRLDQQRLKEGTSKKIHSEEVWSRKIQVLTNSFKLRQVIKYECFGFQVDSIITWNKFHLYDFQKQKKYLESKPRQCAGCFFPITFFVSEKSTDKLYVNLFVLFLPEQPLQF